MNDETILRLVRKENPTRGFEAFKKKYGKFIREIVQEYIDLAETVQEILELVYHAIRDKVRSDEKVEDLPHLIKHITSQMIAERLVLQHYEKIFFVVQRKLGSDDAVQRILNAIIDSLSKKVNQGETFKNLPAYISKICRNQINNEFRVRYERKKFLGQKKNYEHIEEISDDWNDDINNLSEEERKIVFQCLLQLDHVDRAILCMYFVTGMSSKEIASYLNKMGKKFLKRRKKTHGCESTWKEETVRQRKHRALAQIRDCMKKLL